MNESLMDVLPVSPGQYSVTLLRIDPRRHGATLRIAHITANDLFERLKTVLLWPCETIEPLRTRLKDSRKLIHERLEAPTEDQLRELGFDLPS